MALLCRSARPVRARVVPPHRCHGDLSGRAPAVAAQGRQRLPSLRRKRRVDRQYRRESSEDILRRPGRARPGCADRTGHGTLPADREAARRAVEPVPADPAARLGSPVDPMVRHRHGLDRLHHIPVGFLRDPGKHDRRRPFARQASCPRCPVPRREPPPAAHARRSSDHPVLDLHRLAHRDRRELDEHRRRRIDRRQQRPRLHDQLLSAGPAHRPRHRRHDNHRRHRPRHGPGESMDRAAVAAVAAGPARP
jgi:hypothetical protein